MTDILNIKIPLSTASLETLKEAALRLDRSKLFANDQLRLAYHLLSIIDLEDCSAIPENPDNLEMCCKMVLDHFSIQVDGNPASAHFIEDVMGFYRLPGAFLTEYESRVKKDLSAITGLMLRYEKEESCVIDYNKDSYSAKFGSKKIIDFYKRCVRERNLMINYLVEGMYNHALAKSRTEPFLKGIFDHSLSYFEIPYEWAERGIQFYDYKKIDCCSHRLELEMYTEDRQRVIIAYNQGDKKTFYEQLAKFNPPGNVFDKFNSYFTQILPRIQSRDLIFRELKNLYDNEQWIAFSALAMLQVEGIFSDMLELISPNSKFQGLSDKVTHVRPHYKHADLHLDYFQYVLPETRNNLMHTGNLPEEDFKMLSHDMLYDLWHLLSAFTWLENPVILLTRLIKADGARSLHCLNEYNVFLSLVIKIRKLKNGNPKNKDYQDIWNLWIDYQASGNWATDEKEIIETWLELSQVEILELTQSIQKFSSIFGVSHDMVSNAHNKMGTEKEILQKIIKEHMAFEDQIRFVHLYKTLEILDNYKNILLNISIDMAELIDKFNAQNKILKKNLSALKSSIDYWSIYEE